MSDKELIARGAECVTGDLILNRVVVGMYRHGRFTLTPEGASELESGAASAGAPAPVKAAAKAPPKAPAKPTAKTPVPQVKPENFELDLSMPPELDLGAPKDLIDLDDLLAT